jgi:GNAT superfamily N-acetyltransferase
MRFLTFDELTPSMDLDRLLVHFSSLGGATDREAVALWRRRSDLFAEYVGVFAVEGRRVLGQTLVKRLRYTFPDGTETIGAIASVGTRPDRARRGVARAILTEVHRREREAGNRYVALWTNRSWGAHRLYEQLGYRDVFPTPFALRPPRTGPPAPRRLRGIRSGRLADLPELDRLHDRLAAGRLGFCRRPKRLLETSAAVRDFDPARELIVATHRGRPTGFAFAQVTATRAFCAELIAGTARARTALIAEVERRAKGAAVAFGLTPAIDAAALLRGRGYGMLRDGWYVFMAADLRRPWSASAARARFAARDRRFLCMNGDRF